MNKKLRMSMYEKSIFAAFLHENNGQGSTKTRMDIRAGQYCRPLRIRRQRCTAGRRLPAAALNLSSGNAGSCWMR